jgi:hypothetical protein
MLLSHSKIIDHISVIVVIICFSVSICYNPAEE